MPDRTPMPPHVDADADPAPFDALVIVPMMCDRFPDLLDNYGYLARTGDRVLCVDCAVAAPHLEAAEARGWTITDVLLTHHHPDHVAGVDDLRAATGATVWGAQADARRLPALDHALSPGDAIEIGGVRGTVWDVSGHTIGHVAYVFATNGGGVAFTGDSLMAGGCGRLFEGTPAQMLGSLRQFAALPGDTLIASGHEYTATNLRLARTLEPGNAALISRDEALSRLLADGKPSVPTTLSLERETNPFLRSHIASLKEGTGTEGRPDTETFAAARAARDEF